MVGQEYNAVASVTKEDKATNDVYLVYGSLQWLRSIPSRLIGAFTMASYGIGISRGRSLSTPYTSKTNVSTSVGVQSRSQLGRKYAFRPHHWLTIGAPGLLIDDSWWCACQSYRNMQKGLPYTESVS